MHKDAPIIDTHFHVYDSNKLTMPWLENFKALQAVYSMDDYQAAHQDFTVAKSVYIEVDVADDGSLDKEAQTIIPLCEAANGTLFAVLGGHLENRNFMDYISKYASNPYVVGVRQCFFGRDPSETVNSVIFQDNIKQFAALDLLFDIIMPAEHLHLSIDLIKANPDITFVLNHCGLMPSASTDTALWQQWQQTINTLASFDNVHCKISGLIQLCPDDKWTHEQFAKVINPCLDAFGEDRVVFGSNWMVCTLNGSYKRWVEALVDITAHRGDAFLRKLFYSNADALYCKKG